MAQDTIGRIWLFGENAKWYQSDGEQIIEILNPIQLDTNSTLSILNTISPSGEFYFIGDSLRVFNPYTNKVVRSIGVEAPYSLANMFYDSDSLIWGTTRIRENGRTQTYFLQSRNGSSFQLMEDIPPSERYSWSNHSKAKDGFFYTPRIDTVFQYNIDGELRNTYVFPEMNSTVISVRNSISPPPAIEYLHFQNANFPSRNNPTIYSLDPKSSSFKSIFPSNLIGNHFPLAYRLGNTYNLNGSHLASYLFTPSENELIKIKKILLQQHPDFPYFHSTIRQVIKDQTDTYWLTTFKQEVFKMTSIQKPYTQYLVKNGENEYCINQSCVIRGICSDKEGNIYFAYDYGIQKLDVKTGQLKAINVDITADVFATHSLSFFNNKLYLNHLEINPTTGQTRELIPSEKPLFVTHFIDTIQEKIFFASTLQPNENLSPTRLYRYDLKSQQLKFLQEFEHQTRFDISNHVSEFHISPTTNTLFVATRTSGLLELDIEGNLLWQKKGGFFGDYSAVHAIFEDEDQLLWIGSSKGLSVLDLNTHSFKIQEFKNKALLDNIRIYSVHADDEGFIWLGTEKGLYRFDKKTNTLQDFKMFPIQANKEFNRLAHYKGKDGKLYFGSTEGLFAFYPKAFMAASRLNEQYPIQIARFSVYDSELDSLLHSFPSIEQAFSFDVYPKHQYFNFDVFVPDYRNAEKNTYTHWLEGYESNWSTPTNSNTIRYDNLPPGTYTLHVRGGITDDFYESSERSFLIIVHGAWYATWWAISLFIGLFLGLIFLIYRFQINRQLQLAEAKRIRELERFKSQLYTNITHEFRTPLTVIMGMTDNIKGHSQERNLIQRNSKNLLQLINQLLDLSKLDAGQLQLNFVQGDIVSYLRYLTESFYSMAEEKKVRLTFYTEEEELIMDYDESKLQHIIYNLLSNAIKFTPETGQVVLHLKEVQRHNDQLLHIKVSDTGVGIAVEDQQHIFKRYFQGDQKASQASASTGIGLAFTKDLVELMQGSIEVKSKENKGTDFTVLLPIQRLAKSVKDQSYPRPQIEIANPSLQLASNKTEKPSLLIIEDNRDVITYIETLLKPSYQIETARNGQLGIDKALEIIPDIIISDVMMPEKNGYEVCQSLKNDQRTSHIPIILLTAKATTEDRIEGLKEGADAYLNKPFHKEELKVRLEQLLNLRKSLQARYASSAFLLQEEQKSKAPSLDEQFLQNLIQVVEERLADPNFSVADLCQAANLSNMQVNRKLKALTGKTPSRFIRSIRLQKAMQLLQTTQLNVSEIAYDVGFSDPNYFSRSFSEEFGQPPLSIRK